MNWNAVILALSLVGAIIVPAVLIILVKYLSKRDKGILHLTIKFKSFEFTIDTSSEKQIKDRK